MYFTFCLCFFTCLLLCSAIGLKLYVVVAEIKNYKKLIKKKKKKHDKIVLLAKPKLNNIKILICKDLIDTNIRHDDSVLINNLLNEQNNMKEEIKNLKY